jgi:hypothetical protein
MHGARVYARMHSRAYEGGLRARVSALRVSGFVGACRSCTHRVRREGPAAAARRPRQTGGGGCDGPAAADVTGRRRRRRRRRQDGGQADRAGAEAAQGAEWRRRRGCGGSGPRPAALRGRARRDCAVHGPAVPVAGGPSVLGEGGRERERESESERERRLSEDERVVVALSPAPPAPSQVGSMY